MSEWVNIKEKLPPEIVFNSIFIVAMFSHAKLKTFVRPLHYIDGEWFTMLDEEPLDVEYEVTHWMPLPELPYEEKIIDPEWININQRLPEERIEILILSPSLGCLKGYMSIYNRPEIQGVYFFTYKNNIGLVSDVTHWKPLLNSPEKENE